MKLLKEIPYDCWGEIFLFFNEPLDWIKTALTYKGLYNFVIRNVYCLKNIVYEIKDQKNLSECIKYKERIFILNISTILIRVERIEGLESFTQLQGLGLGGNKIQKIEGLENLTQLKELNLWGNEIKK